MEINPSLINAGARSVCQTLSNAGFQAYVVGGCVRDMLLNQEPKDWDICTDATPNQVINLFTRTIPTGLQHGTVTVVLGFGPENHFEVTTFRIEGAYLDGRRPEEVFFVMHVAQDLARRDLTINAMAYDPISGRLEDPFNGLSDLSNGIIRAVGLAESRFQEDGLRIMRAARFAARFGYEIEHETVQGMKSSIENLRNVSKERVSDELCKTLMTKSPSTGLLLLKETGALAIACPILCSRAEHLAFMHEQYKCGGELETRLAFLYANVSLAQANEELTALKMSSREIKKVVFLIQLLQKFNALRQLPNEEVYKAFFATVKNFSIDTWEATLEQFLELTEALHYNSRELFESYKHLPVPARKELKVNGNDLMSAGFKPGPELKKALDECYLEILKYPQNNDRDILVEFATRNL